MLKKHVRYLPDDHLDSLIGEMKSKEIVFLGEVHNVPALHRAADDLVLGLASTRPVVYAWEGCYSVSPFYEAASLGKPNPLSPQQPIPPQIMVFNSTNIPARQIMLTAVDVVHTIYHSKEHPVRYLTEMAHRSTSPAACQALEAHIPRLTATKTYEEVQEYLREAARLFQQHVATFSAADQEEIRFALDLFEASNRYQHASQGLIKTPENPQQVRYEFFIKTIDRAYLKAQQRNAILVTRLGGWHVNLTWRCEAKHFAIDNPATKGKVMAVQLLPVHDEGGKESAEGIDLVAAVKALMKPGHYCYLALPQLNGAVRRALKYSQYYPGNRPICDGLLFVKASKSPET
ncbi:MAG TPA: hypothetical protein P5186_28870 [Candidatus Paceibacterota bacterium]|nr:hypothetical protein [Candidatus Paceibacterota bacterium]